jgi:hypothetical protein
MDVVFHQAKQVQPDALRLNALGHPAKKPLAIVVVAENVLPTIPANGDVTDRSCKLNPDMSWHAGNVPLPRPTCKA